MPFYEIIYEPGTKSIAFYENDDEANSALGAIYERAVTGQPATPDSSPHPDSDAPQAVGTWAAERPIKVLVRNEHPASFTPEIDSSQLTGLSYEEALNNLREQASPLAENPGVQDSQYKMPFDYELDVSNLGG